MLGAFNIYRKLRAAETFTHAIELIQIVNVQCEKGRQRKLTIAKFSMVGIKGCLNFDTKSLA